MKAKITHMVVLFFLCTIIITFLIMIFNVLLSFIVSCIVTFVFIAMMNKKYTGRILAKKRVFMFLADTILISGSTFLSALFWIFANSIGDPFFYEVALLCLMPGLLVLFDDNQAHWLGYVKQ